MANLGGLELRELLSRINQFLALTPEQRKASPIFGKPKGMCEEGQKLFETYCDDPQNNLQFIDHYDRTKGGCIACHDAFFKHIFLVTD